MTPRQVLLLCAFGAFLDGYDIQALGLAASDDDDGTNHGKTEKQLETLSDDQAKQLREMIDAIRN